VGEKNPEDQAKAQGREGPIEADEVVAITGQLRTAREMARGEQSWTVTY
jgi:hypothetical protein